MTLKTCVLFLAIAQWPRLLMKLNKSCYRGTNLLEYQMAAHLIGEQLWIRTKRLRRRFGRLQENPECGIASHAPKIQRQGAWHRCPQRQVLYYCFAETSFNQPFWSFGAWRRTPTHPMYFTSVLRQVTGRVNVPSTTRNHYLDFQPQVQHLITWKTLC